MSRSNFKDWIVEEEKTHIMSNNQQVMEEVRRREAGQADGKGQTRPGKNG